MHIPDGFLNLPVAAATGVLAATGLGVALHRTQRHLAPARVPLLGLTAAFVFAAQMINFPVVVGTSGHLIGAVMTAVLLGPSAAVIVIAAVLVVQCLMFADGGLTALGANLFNMGLVGAVGGWAIYHAVWSVIPGLFGCVLGAAFAAWCSTVLAAVACAAELAAAHTAAWSTVLPAMAGIHMLIGLGEGLITALVVTAIARVRPELLQLEGSARPNQSYGVAAIYGGLLCVGLVVLVAPLASSWPDGLDKVAELLGFRDRAAPALFPAPIADYEMPGLAGGGLAVALAGAVGTVVVFILAWLLARVLVPRTAPAAPTPTRLAS